MNILDQPWNLVFLIDFVVYVGIRHVYALHTPREEEMMCEFFGQEYRCYMRGTGRLFPPRMGRVRFSLLALQSAVLVAAVPLGLARGSGNATALVVLWFAWAFVLWCFIEIRLLGRTPDGQPAMARRDRWLLLVALALATVAAGGATVWLWS
jgi:hypothetical protein